MDHDSKKDDYPIDDIILKSEPFTAAFSDTSAEEDRNDV